MHELLKGLALAWIYAAIRTRFGAGMKTAVLAGLTVWAIMFPVPFIAEMPTGFYGPRMVTMWLLYEIVPTVVGAGFLYKEGPDPSAARRSTDLGAGTTAMARRPSWILRMTDLANSRPLTWSDAATPWAV